MIMKCFQVLDLDKTCIYLWGHKTLGSGTPQNHLNHILCFLFHLKVSFRTITTFGILTIYVLSNQHTDINEGK